MSKLRVGVFMGGKSLENEVSFNSGRTVCDHLDTTRYTPIPLFQTTEGALYQLPWQFLHRGKITDFEHRLSSQATALAWDDLPNLIDFMYIATPGRHGEDGCLQGFLEVLGIPYIGSGVFASALCMDKAMQKYFLHNAGVHTPLSITLLPHEVRSMHEVQHIIIRMQERGITFPCVVKPHKEGSSFGVSVVRSAQDLLRALLHACTVYPLKDQAVLIEQRIEGMEFTSIVLTNYRTHTLFALPATEIVPEPNKDIYDYEQKYMPGRALKITPARVDATLMERIHAVSIQTVQALGLKTFARIDGFVTPTGDIVVIDPGSLSGMAPSSFVFMQAAEIGMSHTHLINYLIETSLEEHGMLNAIEHAEQQTKQTATDAKKIRVGVLLGGASNEKEISLESGRNVVYKLSPTKYETTPLFMDQHSKLFALTHKQLVCNSTQEIALTLHAAQAVRWADLPTKFDFIFIGLHGGLGENGAVQGTLEMLGVPYNGSSVLASALCMDKYKTTQYLQARGFAVPKAHFVERSQWQAHNAEVLANIQATIPAPYIIKPHDDGCSVLVQKATDERSLRQAIMAVFEHGKTHVLVEECIAGMELTVGVIGNEVPRALVPSYAVATGSILSIEEKFLPGAGENQTPAPLLTDALQLVQRTMEAVYEAVGCRGYARIDCFYQPAAQSPTGHERVVILEINSLPGLTPATCIFHQAAELGLKPMDFIDTIVQYGLQEHAKNVAHVQPGMVTQTAVSEVLSI